MDDSNERFLSDFGSQEKLDEYLELNSFENNLDINNLKYDSYFIKHIERTSYSFSYNGSNYILGQLDAYENDSRKFYSFVYSYRYHLSASEDTCKVVILPFFEYIIFYEKFNIFLCFKAPEKIEPTKLNLKIIYYFDTHGRFIKEEKGDYHDIPNIALVENKIIPISINRNDYNIEEIYNYDLFKISKFCDNIEVFNLIDNNGVLYSKDYYRSIIVSKTNESAILDNDNHLVCLDIKSRLIKELPYNYFLDHNDDFIKVIVKNEEQFEKYGIIDYQGNEIVKPNFDFIDFNFTEDRFKVFQGFYKWEDNEELESEFKEVEKLIFDSENGFECEVYGKLTGKWGIINANLAFIIPAIYDWIEEYEEDLYLANIGGSLYEYLYESWEAGENFDKEVLIMSQLVVSGGKWYEITKSGTEVKEIEDIEVFRMTWELIVKNKNLYKKSDKKAKKV